jgi:hypothetical protein
MHNDPIYLLKPMFDWLDGLIRDQGDYIYMLLVYASIPLVAWISSGGLRRRKPRQTNVTAIILIRPTTPPPPPPLPLDIGGGYEPPSDDDVHSFDA